MLEIDLFQIKNKNGALTSRCSLIESRSQQKFQLLQVSDKRKRKDSVYRFSFSSYVARFREPNATAESRITT